MMQTSTSGQNLVYLSRRDCPRQEEAQDIFAEEMRICSTEIEAQTPVVQPEPSTLVRACIRAGWLALRSPLD